MPVFGRLSVKKFPILNSQLSILAFVPNIPVELTVVVIKLTLSKQAIVEDESMSEIDSDTFGKKSHSGILALVSFIFSILAVFAVILSIRRVESVQASPVCLIAETPGYNVIHSLCTLFPTGSLIAGIVALKRMLLGRRKLWSIMFASGGVIISLAILVIYWINLTHLASGHIH